MDATPLPLSPPVHPVVHHVMPWYPLKWLKQGLGVLRKAPISGLFYGVAFVLMGYFLVYYFSAAPHIVITLSTLFLLAGPFLAIGFYDITKQMEGSTGSVPIRVSLFHSMMAWRSNIQGFSLYAVLLAVIVFTWFRISLLMFALFYDTATLTSLSHLLRDALLPSNRLFLLVYFGVGFFFALLVFASSVIALPMLLDKEVDTVTAVITSIQAVVKNALTMLVWAALVVVLCVFGFATYYVGLVITAPLVGFATWYAYRDLVSYPSP